MKRVDPNGEALVLEVLGLYAVPPGVKADEPLQTRKNETALTDDKKNPHARKRRFPRQER